MARSVLSEDRFQNEDAAFAFVEEALWPNGPVCPHCGNADAKRIKKMEGETTRRGLHQCNECRKPFTVRQGTIFESSHLPLHMWLQVIHLMCASKKGISTRQIQRTLNCSMKTAWFLTHRIRFAMQEHGDLPPLGGEGGIVEIDETFIGRKVGVEKPKAGWKHKNVVLTLVHRGAGARSFHVESTKKEDVLPIVRKHAAKENTVMTDEAVQYAQLGQDFERHEAVDHSREEYSHYDMRTDTVIGINTVEGYFSVFKRGMFGTYQHCSEEHLHRYLAEFDFRYNHREKVGFNDLARADRALRSVKGKRLTYETTPQN